MEKEPYNQNASEHFTRAMEKIKDYPEALEYMDFTNISDVERETVIREALKQMKQEGEKNMFYKIFDKFDFQECLKSIIALKKQAGESPDEKSIEFIEKLDPQTQKTLLSQLVNFIHNLTISVDIENVQQHSNNIEVATVKFKNPSANPGTPEAKNTFNIKIRL